MIHRLIGSCSRVGTSRAVVRVSKPLKVSSAATVLVALVEIQELMEAKELLRVVATLAL